MPSYLWAHRPRESLLWRKEPVFDSDQGLKGVSEYLQNLPTNGRMLFLCFGLSGLTTNLQWLISLHQDIIHLRADIQTWIGYRLSSARENPRIGQLSRNGVEWSFYELGKLTECIVGHDQDARYQTLVRALFCIQKCKQRYVLLIVQHLPTIDHFSSKADPKVHRYDNSNSLGEGAGRMGDNLGVKKYLESLMANDGNATTSEDEYDVEDDGSD